MVCDEHLFYLAVCWSMVIRSGFCLNPFETRISYIKVQSKLYLTYYVRALVCILGPWVGDGHTGTLTPPLGRSWFLAWCLAR